MQEDENKNQEKYKAIASIICHKIPCVTFLDEILAHAWYFTHTFSIHDASIICDIEERVNALLREMSLIMTTKGSCAWVFILDYMFINANSPEERNMLHFLKGSANSACDTRIRNISKEYKEKYKKMANIAMSTYRKKKAVSADILEFADANAGETGGDKLQTRLRKLSDDVIAEPDVTKIPELVFTCEQKCTTEIIVAKAAKDRRKNFFQRLMSKVKQFFSAKKPIEHAHTDFATRTDLKARRFFSRKARRNAGGCEMCQAEHKDKAIATQKKVQDDAKQELKNLIAARARDQTIAIKNGALAFAYESTRKEITEALETFPKTVRVEVLTDALRATFSKRHDGINACHSLAYFFLNPERAYVNPTCCMF